MGTVHTDTSLGKGGGYAHPCLGSPAWGWGCWARQRAEGCPLPCAVGATEGLFLKLAHGIVLPLLDDVLSKTWWTLSLP